MNGSWIFCLKQITPQRKEYLYTVPCQVPVLSWGHANPQHTPLYKAHWGQIFGIHSETISSIQLEDKSLLDSFSIVPGLCNTYRNLTPSNWETLDHYSLCLQSHNIILFLSSFSFRINRIDFFSLHACMQTIPFCHDHQTPLKFFTLECRFFNSKPGNFNNWHRF